MLVLFECGRSTRTEYAVSLATVCWDQTRHGGGGDVMYILINVDPVYCSLLIDVIFMVLVGATATYELDALDAGGEGFGHG